VCSSLSSWLPRPDGIVERSPFMCTRESTGGYTHRTEGSTFAEPAFAGFTFVGLEPAMRREYERDFGD
jgi:hypothetical protein